MTRTNVENLADIADIVDLRNGVRGALRGIIDVAHRIDLARVYAKFADGIRRCPRSYDRPGSDRRYCRGHFGAAESRSPFPWETFRDRDRVTERARKIIRPNDFHQHESGRQATVGPYRRNS
jgi:hypothetical protein